MKALKCRNCGAGLPLAGIDRRLGVLSCEHCGTVHDMARDPVPVQRNPDDPANPPARRIERAEVAMPARFKIERRDGAIHVGWPKGRLSGAVALGGFATIWLVLTALTGLLPLMAVGLLLGIRDVPVAGEVPR